MPNVMTKTCPYCVEEIHQDAIKCKHCGSWLARPPEGTAAHGPVPSNGHGDPYFSGIPGKEPYRRLTRTTGSAAMVSGVCGGVARLLGVDATWVRLVVALATFFTAIIPGMIIYLILSLVIPRDDSVPV